MGTGPPPAPPNPGSEPVWSSYRSVSYLWKAVAVLLAVATAIDAGAVISDLIEYELLGRIASGEPFTIPEAEASDLRQGVIGIVQTVALIATGIPFIVWTHRAYSNLPALGIENLRFRRWWSIGGWFIPVFSAFRPKQIINDIWRAGSPELAEQDAHEWRNEPVPAWWMLWWLAFVIANEAYLVATRLWLSDTDTIEQLRNSSLGFIVADSMSVVAGVLAIFVLRGASLRQLERARRLGV